MESSENKQNKENQQNNENAEAEKVNVGKQDEVCGCDNGNSEGGGNGECSENGEDKFGKHEKGHCRKELEKAKAELEKAKADAEENKRKWYAVTAEYENYRRRTQAQASQRYTEGRNDVIASLFPIGDNLERALAACSDEKTAQGLEMVLKSYKKLLEDEKIEELDPTGQPFDADVAEAIMAVPSEAGEEAGIVKQVYVKGYKRGDKVLRYAQVIVTQ